MTFPYPEDSMVARYYERDSSEEERADKKLQDRKKKKQVTYKTYSIFEISSDNPPLEQTCRFIVY